jgi:hypothetical protein
MNGNAPAAGKPPAADKPPTTGKAPRNNALRNYVAYAVLIACVIVVHFIVELDLNAMRSVAQAAVFSAKGVAIVGGLGLLGVFFLNLTQLRGFWDPDLGVREKIRIPAISGLIIGVGVVACDLVTGWSRIMAAEMHLPTIHIAFPLSIPIYFGGAIIVTIIYYLILIPFLDWLIALRLLKGKREQLVFWAVAIPLAFVEPLSQGDFAEIPHWGWIAVPAAVGDIVMNLVQVGYLRSAGFIAAVAVRVGFYAMWHVLYGLF